MSVTVRAPTNIALIKYWGKRDISLNLPLNSSISLTIDINHFYSETTVTFTPSASSFLLNNRPSPLTSRILKVISTLTSLTTPPTQINIEIRSFNNFPTSAGMASSASGLAALTFALSKLLSLNLSNEELSSIARLGSGSASRSLFGGLVEWTAGTSHSTSIAHQVFPSTHWPELRILVVVCESKTKSVPSTEAMLQETEELHKRVEQVPERIESLKAAFERKDFGRLGRIVMDESDSLHYVINSSGVRYLNEASEVVKEIVNEFNREGIKAAYTFDAGPNAWIITTEESIGLLTNALLRRMKIELKDISLRVPIDPSVYIELQSTAVMPIEGLIEAGISTSGPYQVS